MTERKIYCNKCGIFCGTIRDASLRKGLVYVCQECNSEKGEDNEYLNIFGDLFSTKRKD